MKLFQRNNKQRKSENEHTPWHFYLWGIPLTLIVVSWMEISSYIEKTKWLRNTFEYLKENVAGLFVGIIGLVVCVGGFLYVPQDTKLVINKLVSDFYANFGTELISIGITVLILESLNNRRQRKETILRLLDDIRFGHEAFKTRAIREIVRNNWHKNGTLSGENLSDINFENADLSHVNFEGCNLKGVNFTGAILTWGNFKNTNLENANLTRADLGAANFSGSNINVNNVLGNRKGGT